MPPEVAFLVLSASGRRDSLEGTWLFDHLCGKETSRMSELGEDRARLRETYPEPTWGSSFGRPWRSLLDLCPANSSGLKSAFIRTVCHCNSAANGAVASLTCQAPLPIIMT